MLLNRSESSKSDACSSNADVVDVAAIDESTMSLSNATGEHVDARDVALAAANSKVSIKAGYFVSYFHKVSALVSQTVLTSNSSFRSDT